METKNININGNKFTGVKINLKNAPLLMIISSNGFLACGYIDVKTCNQLNDVVAIVKGVNSFEEMLKSEIVNLSQRAKEIIKNPINGREFLLAISNR